ncbi:MAG TPA: hypothetical protein VGK67_31590 [Myxococcales bacterium]|jgi:hypothetical protein
MNRKLRFALLGIFVVFALSGCPRHHHIPGPHIPSPHHVPHPHLP